MKKTFSAIVFSALAACAAAQDISKMSKKQIVARDKELWANVDGNLALGPNSKSTIAGELASISAKLQQDYAILGDLIKNTREKMGSSSSPEYYFEDAGKTLAKSVVTQTKADFDKLYPTPAQKEAIRGYKNTLRFLTNLDREMRVPFRTLMSEVKNRKLITSYLKISRFEGKYEKSDFHSTLKSVEKKYYKLVKTIDTFAQNKGKYKTPCENLVTRDQRQAVLKKMLDDHDLVKFMQANGRPTVRFGRSCYVLDKYLKEMNASKIAKVKEDLTAYSAEHNKVAQKCEDFRERYYKIAFEIPPSNRESVALAMKGYFKYMHEASEFFNKTYWALIDRLEGGKTNMSKLRSFKELGDAWKLAGSASPSDGEPQYLERANAMAKDIQKRFDDACIKISEKQGKPAVAY